MFAVAVDSMSKPTDSGTIASVRSRTTNFELRLGFLVSDHGSNFAGASKEEVKFKIPKELTLQILTFIKIKTLIFCLKQKQLEII